MSSTTEMNTKGFCSIANMFRKRNRYKPSALESNASEGFEKGNFNAAL
jgi:hypothetical protein